MRDLLDQEDVEAAVPVNALTDTIEVGLIVDTFRVAHEVMPLIHRARTEGAQVLAATFTPDVIAAKIREIDGAHDMGAGEMGERLSEWIAERAR